MKYSKRIDRLEKQFNNTFSDVLLWIKEKRYYDEMTHSEKNIYCDYWGCKREVMEEIRLAITGTLHFQIEKKPTPLAPEQHQVRIKEIEETLSK